MSDLKSFLKQYSTIPNAFIDKFLSFYNPDTIQTDFIINVDQVAEWLGMQKFNIIDTLKKSYRGDIDYTITATTRRTKKYGGNNYKLVMITPDCFKRLCMRSRTKKAEEVRTYFIQLESLMVRFRSVILKGMDVEIKQLESALKPKDINDSAGYIYVIKASPEKDNVYKIGRTQNLNKRLATYSVGTVDGIETIYKFRTNSFKKTEACLKLMLKEHQLRKYKEVYQANIDMIKTIIQKCDDTVQYTKVYSNVRAERNMTGGYYIVIEKDD